MYGIINKWKNPVIGLFALTRFREYVIFVIVTTLMGAMIQQTPIDWRLSLVLVANWLAVGFAFMFNDIEDAVDDARDPAKVDRNPVSAGKISTSWAYVATFFVALVAAILYFFLGLIPFSLGMACLVLGVLYSWKKIRLKRFPVLDLVSHVLMLAGLQLLCAYTIFSSITGTRWIAPFIVVVSISMYGELFNEVRDMEGDRKAGLKHTVALLGERAAHILMVVVLVIAGLAFIYTIIIGMIPLWLIVILVILSIILLSRPIFKLKRGSIHENSKHFQDPVLMIGALVLLIWLASRLVGL
jgi:4-hydroxybenzoate polyprenyltransferase